MPKKPSKTPASAAPAGNADLDLLRELVKLLDSSSATSIKLGRGEVSYEVSRMVMPDFGQLARNAMPQGAPQQHLIAHAASGGHAPPAAAAAPAEAPKSNFIDIKSPMVGTFYRAPEPGADPYVKPGTRINAGQTLCIIEAMKIMNEIESEVSGTVREVPVEDASPVEFGQVLFRVEPHV
jgi:acetyl-CoA carboxylase biotin carboxyl carrier protein